MDWYLASEILFYFGLMICCVGVLYMIPSVFLVGFLFMIPFFVIQLDPNNQLKENRVWERHIEHLKVCPICEDEHIDII